MIGNTIHKDRALVDMRQYDHIFELSDAYAIKLLFEWIGTKYRIIDRDSYMESGEPDVAESLGIAAEYPYNVCGAVRLPKTMLTVAFAALDEIADPEPRLLGSLHEQISDSPLLIDSSGSVYIQKTKDRRISGQFYTPKSVVSYCLSMIDSSALNGMISHFKQDEFSPQCGRSDSAPPLGIFDPACGSGSFLLGALEFGMASGVPPEGISHLASECIFGTDIDGRAVSIARLSLLLFCRYVCSGDALIAPYLSEKLRKNITVADSIYAPLSDSHRDAFDIVMTNPPYVSFGSRNQQKPLPSYTSYLRSQYPESAEYKIRLHSIFQDVAIQCTKHGGKTAFLLPDAFLTGSYYSKLRRKLLSSVRVQSITECADSLIPSATVGRWCIPIYSKDVSEPADKSVRVASITQNGTEDSLAVQATNLLPIDVFVSPDKSRFRLLFHNMDVAIFGKMDSLPTLNTVLQGHTGMRSRIGQSAIIDSSKSASTFRKGLISGSCVLPHRVHWDGMWLNVQPDLLFSGGFDPTIVESPKLLVRQTGDRIVAGYDDCGFYHLNNIHSFSPVSTHDRRRLQYLTGLLNSAFWLYLYQLKTREDRRAMAQIDIETVEYMPIPVDNSTHETYIANLSEFLRRSRGEAESSLRAIDRVVYALYNLDEDEIEHVETYVRARRSTMQMLPTLDKALEIAK
jgi:adenine-specific DNA-methyltransferase